MSHKDIKIKGKNASLHKAFMQPSFESSTVLVDDQFDYVNLWLKRKHVSTEAVLYWTQARNFYKASLNLPNESKALTAYYCIMNATKALLTAKGLSFNEQHGIAGESHNNRTSLANEISKIKGAGILPALANCFGADISSKEFNLKDIFYNLPFIHRAYTITYRESQNLFIPITDGHFVRQPNGQEAWFCATITDPRYQKDAFIIKQRGWERDHSETERFVIRCKRRFRWQVRGTSKAKRMENLRTNHKKVRRDMKYIHGPSRLWYFKRNDRDMNILTWPTPALTYIAMHRLSELTRYDPSRLHKHLDCQHNWLLSEFLRLAVENFIDQIASDITGHEFMVPGYRK